MPRHLVFPSNPHISLQSRCSLCRGSSLQMSFQWMLMSIFYHKRFYVIYRSFKGGHADCQSCAFKCFKSSIFKITIRLCLTSIHKCKDNLNKTRRHSVYPIAMISIIDQPVYCNRQTCNLQIFCRKLRSLLTPYFLLACSMTAVTLVYRRYTSINRSKPASASSPFTQRRMNLPGTASDNFL